jgi:hypothetical protein
MLGAEDMGSGGESLTWIPREQIRAVRVKRVGFITVSSLWFRYAVESGHGAYQFRVPERDNPHVVRAFREIAGDRFNERPKRRPTVGESVLLLLGAVLGIQLVVTSAFLVSGFVRSPAELSVTAVVAFVLGVVPLVLLWLFVGVIRWDRNRSELRLDRGPRPRRRTLSLRRPFRSRILGWAFKIVGLVYVALVYTAPSTTVADGNSLWHILVAAVRYLPGAAAIIVGYRLCLRTFEPHRHPDPRRPVLFLRAFDDDGKKSLQPAGFLALVHGIFTYNNILKVFALDLGIFTWFLLLHPIKLIKLILNVESYTSEETFGAAFRRCGPFVAIGRPGETLLTPGADRMYVPDGEWQKTVLAYLELSQAVILQPARSDGVRWEIEQVFARVPRDRVMLNMINFKDHPQLYEEFRDWLAREHGIRLSVALPFHAVPSIVYFESDKTVRYQPICYRSPLLWTFVGNAVDSRRTFSTFLQGLQGGPRELPLHPKPHFGHAALSVPLAAFAWLGFLLVSEVAFGSLRPYMAVAWDITRDKVSANMIGGQEPAKQAVYSGGGSLPYRFSLVTEWVPSPIPPGNPDAHHLFDYRGGLGKFSVVVRAGKPLPDFFSETMPTDVRDAIEQRVRAEKPKAEVRLIGSRWVTLHGVQWREVFLMQDYGLALREMKRVLFYSSPQGSIVLSLILPGYEHYNATADRLVSTFRAPRTDLDKLIANAKDGVPVVYRGRKAPYRWALPPIWVPTNLSKQLTSMGQTVEGLRALGVESYEHSFELAGGGFAALAVRVEDGEEELQSLEKIAKELYEKLNRSVESAMPGYRFRFDPKKPMVVNLGDCNWAEFNSLVSVSKDDFSGQFWMTQRLTNHKGRFLSVEARIMKDHPDIRRIVREALDAIRLGDE